ncbi:unnamed protein product [Arabis nemorensis]|uniref:Pyruvate kinase C-terminal domain-containing protein n=1 Tax=Arabis nemorensis TaxID=586526 RepID=A0A565BRL9_9BRAS|nr:unnamed protein product [Arabis nemorensis]
MEAHVASRGLVYRGIIPLMGSGSSKSTEELITFGIEAAKNEEICKVGDSVLALRLVDGSAVMLPLMVVD